MRSYFKTPNIFWWILIPGVFTILLLALYYPHIVPLTYFGAPGRLLSNIVSRYPTALLIGLWATVIAHGFEAMIARSICRMLNLDNTATLLWIIQTFILGFINNGSFLCISYDSSFFNFRFSFIDYAQSLCQTIKIMKFYI